MPVAVSDCNSHIGRVNLQDQMLQHYLLKQKKGSQCYEKLFKTLLNVTIQDSMFFSCFLAPPQQKNSEKHGSKVPCPAREHSRIAPPPK
jgi:hypothetical protein